VYDEEEKKRNPSEAISDCCDEDIVTSGFMIFYKYEDRQTPLL
jgi:hypothetical protein